jgi:hypothetical protein
VPALSMFVKCSSYGWKMSLAIDGGMDGQFKLAVAGRG